MKKIKTLVAAGLISMALASCGEQPHQHTFAAEWSTDSAQHWHAATCEHTDQKSDLGAHVDSDGDKKCDVCQYNMGSQSKDKIKNVSGGTAQEQKAIQTCASRSIVLLSGSTTIAIGNVTDLLEDNGDYVLLTYSQDITVSGTKYNVQLEWEMDTSSPYFSQYSEKGDDHHKLVIFKYPGKGGVEGSIELKLKKISCGGASSVDTGVKYDFNIKAATLYHENVTIAQLNKLKKLSSGEYGYDIVDYESDPAHAYFIKNNEEVEGKYYYIGAVGKMIYYAPDGNWGLLADGDQIMEVYAGSALDILPSRYPLMKDKYVRVLGNMSQYMGNVQIGFVTDMVGAKASDITEPTMNYQEITPSHVGLISRPDGTHKQCVNIGGEDINLSNALKSIKGTYVADSLMGVENDVPVKWKKSQISAGKRFTFDVNIGDGKIVTVAYDYHVDKEGKLGIFNALNDVIDSTKTVTIKGTLRFNGDDSNPFNQTGGHWQLVPFLAEHIA